MVHLVGLELYLPVAIVDACHLVGLVFLPVVELADDVYLCSVGSPLAQHPAACSLVESEVEVSACKVGECVLPSVGQLGKFVNHMLVASSDSRFERFEPWVVLDETDVFHFWCGLCSFGLCSRLFSSCLSLAWCHSIIFV